MRDFKRMQNDPPEGVNGAPQDNDIMKWHAVIFGCLPTSQPRPASFSAAKALGASSNSLARVSFQRLSQPNSEITDTISTI